MAPQLQINQGPQDALLFDNTRSYFTNVGYVRTSNFQMELRDVDPQNTANLGGTVNFVIPKAADLLGPVDLMIAFNEADNTPGPGNIWGWVDSVGYAMIEKITFSVGSHDVEVLTGDHLNIMNELMRSDSHRYGFNQTLKTGRPLAVAEMDHQGINGNVTDFHYYIDGNRDPDSYDRIIAYDSTIKQGKRLVIPLGLFFTTHPSKYFPLAAIAGSNDVRISVKFRTLQELLLVKGVYTTATDANNKTTIKRNDPPTDAMGSFIKFAGSGSAFASNGCFLRCHYIHVTGPEATALMNREHVRLMKLWNGNEVSKQYTVACTATGAADTLDLDLSFLHPVQELIITIRKVADMGSAVNNTIAIGTADKPARNTAQTKNYFAYHGSGKGDPNLETISNSVEGNPTGNAPAVPDVPGGTYLKTKTFTLKINGQSRHLDGQGIDRDYLMNRLLPMLHSNSSVTFEHVHDTATITPLEGYSGTSARFPDSRRQFKQLQEMLDRKEIYVYPFALNPEGANPSGSVNFSKVSHAKLSIAIDGFCDTGSTSDEFQVDVYGIYYNWLAIKDGRALTSFA